MANDNSPNQKPDIDLDDVEIEILVIAKNAKSFSQTAAFLSRRGWPTTVLSSMSQSIEFIADRKPDFVLISLNHPSPAVLKLPDLITGTFNLTCIGFVEQQDAASNARLAKARIKYKIQGQASGPSLHRSIRKILAEKLNINIDGESLDRSSSRRSDNSGGSDNDSVTIREGGKGNAGSTVTIKGEGNKAANGGTIIQKSSGSLMQGSTGSGLIKGDDSQEFQAVDKNNEVLSTGKYTMAKANRRSLKQISQEAGIEAAPENSAEDQAAKLAAMKKALFGDKKTEEAETDAMIAAVAESLEMQATSEGPANKEYQATSEGPANSGPMQATQGSVAQTGELSAKSGSLSSAGNDSATSGTPFSTGEKQATDDGRRSKGPDLANFGDYVPTPAATPASGTPVESSNRSLLERVVESTLEAVCKPAKLHTPVGNTTMRVGVFPIDSPDKPGYLVFATAMAERAAIPWFKEAEKALIKQFTDAGVAGRFEPGFWVTVPEVNFGSWSQEEAKFSVTVNHEGIEVTASFFPTKKALPKITDPSGSGMVSLDVESVSTDHPVNFKAYLHMRKNKKFYLYLRNGRKLAPEQKKRLQESNVQNFHMKIVDKENVRMFLAASFLSDTIRKLGRKKDAA